MHCLVVISSLVTIHSNFDFHYFHFQYFTLVNVCVDIMKTLCSSKRIKSILATAERVVDDPSALLKVISWSKAIASGLEKIKENFETFPDIVEPFVLAIRQVRLMSFCLL